MSLCKDLVLDGLAYSTHLGRHTRKDTTTMLHVPFTK